MYRASRNAGGSVNQEVAVAMMEQLGCEVEVTQTALEAVTGLPPPKRLAG